MKCIIEKSIAAKVAGALAVGLGVAAVACSQNPEMTAAEPTNPACGNGSVDANETCDTAIASGASACPSTCDDGDACTADTIVGSACTTSCISTKITACVSGDGCCAKGCSASEDEDCIVKCGDGVVGGGETCDVGITNGRGACPTNCTSNNACMPVQLQGSGCQAQCVESPITIAKPGDGCCPSGATRASDSDCKGAYGDTCVLDADCASELCTGKGKCTKTCSMTGAIAQCGQPGDFCFEAEGGGALCFSVVDTGPDNDDKYVGIGVTYPSSLGIGDDLDAFVADLGAGGYTIRVLPTEPGADVAFDVYSGVTKIGSMNAAGAGLEEVAVLTNGAAGRVVVVVRSANGLSGNYTVRIDKTS